MVVVDDHFTVARLIHVGVATPFAEEFVAARAAGERVRAPAAVDHIVPVAAVEHVIAVAAVNQVVALTAEDRVIASQTQRDVVARARVQRVAIGGAVEHVVAVGRGVVGEIGRDEQVAGLRIGHGLQSARRGHRAGQLKARALKSQRRIHRCRQQSACVGLQPTRKVEHARLPVGIDELDAFQIARQIVDAGVLQRDRAARTAFDQQYHPSVGVQGGGKHRRQNRGTEGQRVRAFAGGQPVMAVAVVEDDHIVARAGVDAVIARLTSDQIVAGTRVHVVVAAASRDDVIAGSQVDVVVVAACLDGDRLAGVVVNVVIGLAAEDRGRVAPIALLPAHLAAIGAGDHVGERPFGAIAEAETLNGATPQVIPVLGAHDQRVVATDANDQVGVADITRLAAPTRIPQLHRHVLGPDARREDHGVVGHRQARAHGVVQPCARSHDVGVVTRAAVERVAVGAAIQCVITGFAEELVAPRAASEHVVALATIDHAVLLGARQRILVRRAVEDFRAFADIELGQHIVHVQTCAVVEVEAVDALPTVEPFLDAHRVARRGDGGDQVVAVAAECDVVLANAGLEQHAAIVVGNGVLAIAGTEAVGVITAQVLELVVSGAAIQRVVLVTANDRVITRCGGQRPCRQFGAIPHRAVGKAQLLDPSLGRPRVGLPAHGELAAIRQGDGHVALQRPAHGDIGGGDACLQLHRVRASGVAFVDYILPVAQRDAVGVGTRAAFEPIIARAADQDVVAVAAKEFVIARAAHDHVIAPIEAAQFIITGLAQQTAGFDRLHIPHRAIGKNDFLHREAVALVEMVLDDERLAGVADGDLQVIADLPAVDRAHPLQPHIGGQHTRLELDAVGLILLPGILDDRVVPIAPTEAVGVAFTVPVVDLITPANDTAAAQHIVARAAVQNIPARAAEQHVIPALAGQHIRRP